jgi:hypothetical protein
VRTSRVQAVVAVAVAGVVAVAEVAAKKEGTAHCRARRMANMARVQNQGVCLPAQRVTTASNGRSERIRARSRANGSIVPEWHANRTDLGMGSSDRTPSAKVTVTESPLPVAAAGADVVAVAAAVATVKERSAASARRPIARAENRHVAPPTVSHGSPRVIPLEILTMSRCRPVMACGSPRGLVTPPDRMHPGPEAAKHLAAHEQTTVSRGRQVAAVVVAAVGAKAAAPLAAPRHPQPLAAEKAPRAAVRAAPQRAAANVAAGAAVGVPGRSAVPHRRSTAVVAMSLLP